MVAISSDVGDGAHHDDLLHRQVLLMGRNVECTGHPHNIRLGCGWKGERFPHVQMTRDVPFTLLPGAYRVFTDDWINAISTKPCPRPRCGGIVMPIPTDWIGWPAEAEVR